MKHFIFILQLPYPFIGFAAMLYYEGRISRNGKGDYNKLVRGFEKLYPEFKKNEYQPGDPLWHLVSHAEHDIEHERQFRGALIESIRNEEDIEAIKQGMTKAQETWEKFWEKF